MSQSDFPHQTKFDDALLHTLADLDPEAAQAYLHEQIAHSELTVEDAVHGLTAATLAVGEENVSKAQGWLTLARALAANTSRQTNTAHILHAEARLLLHEGKLAAAEAALMQARMLWQEAGDSAVGDSAAEIRVAFGLTHVLTLQGKYIAAQVTAEQAVATLNAAVSSTPSFIPLLITALQNQGNLYGYQHHHHQALAVYDRALQIIQDHHSIQSEVENASVIDLTIELTIDPAIDPPIESPIEPPFANETACIQVSRAVDLMALARLQDAEHALRSAIYHFEQSTHRHLASYAYSNLASLYAQTGQYTQALATFDQALHTCYGSEVQIDEVTVEELQITDVMLLDRAQVFLALNLRQETDHALTIAERLFTYAQRPYELAQTLYTRGLLHIQEATWDAADAALRQAEQTFAALQNQYWQNRTNLARIELLRQQDKQDAAVALLMTLIDGTPTALDEQWYGWDLGTATELFLQHLQLSLDRSDLATAQHAATIIADLFRLHFGDHASSFGEGSDDQAGDEESVTDYVTQEEHLITFGVPHLRFAYLYALGRIARTSANLPVARRYFQQAVALLESQRATLPLEELRIAFLSDKSAVYTDWLLTLLDESADAEQNVSEAFAVVERARSRALLELLIAALDEEVSVPGIEHVETRRDENIEPETTLTEHSHIDDSIDDTIPHDADNNTGQFPTQYAAVRRHLHYLYSQLLGQEGARRLQTEQLHTIRKLEFRLDQLRRQHQRPAVAAPVELTDLQSVLYPDEHVLTYYIAGEEVLLFSVTRSAIRLFRRLCSLAELRKAQRDLQFQMGRLPVGTRALQALDPRAQRLLQQALHRCYQLLLKPLEPILQEQQLRIIPHGLLHQLPFHAFWTGSQYLIEQFKCSYAPSASIAVYQAGLAQKITAQQAWSGLAVTDQGIPETATEVNRIAPFFSAAQLYLGEAASRAGLAAAAKEADVLHVSTHGLMRSDNPLFSSLKLADGWIDVREIYQLDLRAQLVVLSACRSGFSQIYQGDELLGLVRGFLGAGASKLLASQWDVDDAYAPEFMVRFYQTMIQDGLDPVAALRAAQLDAIGQDHHPYWWAPFFIIG